MKKKILGLIPARLKSKRFPNKLLMPLENLPIVVHVYKRALKSKYLNDLFVCCDHKKILELSKIHDVKMIMTSKIHRNGSERINEAYKKINKKYDLIVDIQGDEPLINPNHIDQVIKFHLKNYSADIVVPNLKIKDFENRNLVKIISNKKNDILYFSRYDVPYDFNSKKKYLKKHLSIVSFKPSSLKKYCSFKRSNIEKKENIELLRALDIGLKLKTFTLNGDSFSVDVKKDYIKAKKYIKRDKLYKTYK